jgi:hypothetical protein
MARILSIIIIALFPFVASAQSASLNPQFKDSTYKAEIACGQCQFKMAGTSCDLAVRMNG